MKKSLIALATLAAAGASFAQSSVQIYGGLDAGYQALNFKGTKVNGIAGNGASTSALFVKGTEDLGGGLSANFLVETDWNVVSGKANTGAITATPGAADKSTAGTFAGGEIKVGLAGAFGTVDLGSPNYNSLSSYLTGQPFGTAIGSGFKATAAGLVRAENAVRYITPNFNGFNAVLYKSNKQTKGSAGNTDFQSTLGAYDQTGISEVGVNYANGPLAASFSNQKQDNRDVGTGTTETTYNTLGANYAFGAAKLFGLYQTTKNNTNTVDAKNYSVSGTYAIGQTTLMVQVGEYKNNVLNTTSKLSSLGADYALSKRTIAYVRYENINDKAGVAAITGFPTIVGETTRARTAVGVRHAF
jgi:predicted porin